MAKIDRLEAFAFRAPVAAPVRTSFGTMADRPTLLVRLTDSDGASGWGEVWCNFPTPGAEYKAHLLERLVAPLAVGMDADDPSAIWPRLTRELHVLTIQAGEPGAIAAVLAGVDIALHDLAARKAGVPLHRHLGGSDGRPLPVYASGINPGPGAVETVARARANGYRAFKIKIGFTEDGDRQTLEGVARTLQEGERLLTDVNQRWDVASAVRGVQMLADLPIGWIEEPIAADRPGHEWAQVAAMTRSPLAAGENIQGALGFAQVLQDRYLGFVQPDICKWGGLTGTLPVARAVLGAGAVYCPHYLGGGVGLAASLHMLAAIRGPGLLEVDFNPNPLRENLLGDHLTIRDGMIAVPSGAGLGVVPAPEMFRALQTTYIDVSKRTLTQ